MWARSRAHHAVLVERRFPESSQEVLDPFLPTPQEKSDIAGGMRAIQELGLLTGHRVERSPSTPARAGSGCAAALYARDATSVPTREDFTATFRCSGACRFASMATLFCDLYDLRSTAVCQ
jgi:hypothetical protein